MVPLMRVSKLRSDYITFLSVWLASILFLIWPMIINGSPILFYDSAAYLRFGQKIWAYLADMAFGLGGGSTAPANPGQPIFWAPDDDGVLSGGRSYFYSIAAWGARAGQSYTLIVIAQAAWIGAITLMTLRRLGIASPLSQLGVIAVLSIATPLAFFTCTVLPDVFAAVVPLSITLLVLFGCRMSGTEKTFWAVSLLAAILFHKAFLLVAAIMLAVTIALAAWYRLRTLAGGAVVLVVILLSGGLDIIVHKRAEIASGQHILAPPFLIARGIGDGTITMILDEDCARPQGERWATCHLVDNMPMTENEFLWGQHGWRNLPLHLRKAVVAEQLPLVVAVVTRFPAAQISRTAENILIQFTYPNILEFIQPGIISTISQQAPDTASNTSYLRSRVPQGTFPIRTLSHFWLSVYIATFLGSLALLFFGRARKQREDTYLVPLLWLLVLSLCVSAAVTGGVAGPFGRYQARIAWIATLVFCVIVVRFYRTGGERERPMAVDDKDSRQSLRSAPDGKQ